MNEILLRTHVRQDGSEKLLELLPSHPGRHGVRQEILLRQSIAWMSIQRTQTRILQKLLPYQEELITMLRIVEFENLVNKEQ